MTTEPIVKKRITVLDALRGFALISIMLLHNVERFEIYGYLPVQPDWLNSLDSIIWDSMFFMFGGKSYAIFALLFGVTFFIQSHNQEKIGKDFRPRFILRMFWLLLFGLFNTLFYQGEILVFYALVALFILPFARLSNKALFASAVFFLLQPLYWIRLIIAIQHPELPIGEPVYMEWYARVGNVFTEGNMFEIMKSNITNGRIATILWCWENGRVDQSLGLFLLGFWLGRKALLMESESSIKTWKKVLIISAIAFLPLYILQSHTDIFCKYESVSGMLSNVIRLWSNLALMFVWVSGFILLFYKTRAFKWLNVLSPVGRMSLSNYLIQSIIGSFIYYNMGLSMYKYAGYSECLLIGILLAALQIGYSTWWFKTHKRGPLESIWHKLTWLGKKD